MEDDELTLSYVSSAAIIRSFVSISVPIMSSFSTSYPAPNNVSPDVTPEAATDLIRSVINGEALL